MSSQIIEYDIFGIVIFSRKCCVKKAAEDKLMKKEKKQLEEIMKASSMRFSQDI